MFSQRQIWMETTNRRRSQMVKAMPIHLLSLKEGTKSIREQHSQTHMEKAWANGRKALIKSPRLSCLHCRSMAPWAVIIRLKPSSELRVSVSQDTTAACWTFRSSSAPILSGSFVNNVHRSIVIDLEILIIIIQAQSALRVALRSWASYIPKLPWKANQKEKSKLSHTEIMTVMEKPTSGFASA